MAKGVLQLGERKTDFLEEKCPICSSNSPEASRFFSVTKEELDQLPPLDEELKDELVILSKLLRDRAEEEWVNDILQTPLKRNNVEKDR